MTRSIVLFIAAALAAGCGLVEDPSPEEVRLVIEGDSDKPVRLVVSTRFIAGVNPDGRTLVELFASDTVITTLPYSQTYGIEEDQRFFVETASLEADLQNVALEVFVDQRRVFDDASSLPAGARPRRFVYVFNQPLTRVIEVL